VLVKAILLFPPIVFTLTMEALRLSERWVPTRATRCKIPGDLILSTHRGDSRRSYIVWVFFCEQCVEENIFTEEGSTARRVEKTA
jgi:hypothetical protein